VISSHFVPEKKSCTSTTPPLPGTNDDETEGKIEVSGTTYGGANNEVAAGICTNVNDIGETSTEEGPTKNESSTAPISDQRSPDKKKRKAKDGVESVEPNQRKKRKSPAGGSAKKKGSSSTKQATPRKRLPTTPANFSEADEAAAATTPSEGGGESKENNSLEGETVVEVKQQESNKRAIYRPRQTFDERLHALVNYKEKHGDCYVPHRFKEDRSLGDWVNGIRRNQYKITTDQRRLLNAVGFVWETANNRREREWNTIVQKLMAYKEQFGACHVPWKYDEDPSLSEWVRTQRKLNRKGTLREERKAKLNSIGFLWLDGKSNTNAAETINHHQQQHDSVVTATLKAEEDNDNAVEVQQQQWEAATAAAAMGLNGVEFYAG